MIKFRFVFKKSANEIISSQTDQLEVHGPSCGEESELKLSRLRSFPGHVSNDDVEVMECSIPLDVRTNQKSIKESFQIHQKRVRIFDIPLG